MISHSYEKLVLVHDCKQHIMNKKIGLNTSRETNNFFSCHAMLYTCRLTQHVMEHEGSEILRSFIIRNVKLNWFEYIFALRVRDKFVANFNNMRFVRTVSYTK